MECDLDSGHILQILSGFPIIFTNESKFPKLSIGLYLNPFVFGRSNKFAIGAHLYNLFLYSTGTLGLPHILCAFLGLLLNGAK